MEIFLVGMPGSGKSTLGKSMAVALNLKFIDLDQEICDKEGKDIAGIFTEEGENYFRKLEARLLRKIAENQKNYVLATGGGTPCFFDSMNFMNSLGTTIYIKIPISDLSKRILTDQGMERPLLKSESEKQVLEKLEALFTSRIRYYESSQLTVDANNINQEILLDLVRKTSKN
jgi:shikimate kinase